MAIVGTPYLKSAAQHALSNNTVSEIEIWQVITDGTSTLPEVRDASGVPVYYARKSDNFRMYVAGKRVRPQGTSNQHFEVEVEYTGDLLGDDWPEQISEIITRDPDLEWSTEETVENIDTDIDGDMIQNVNREDFDPPLTDTKSYTSLTISRNELFNEYSAAKAESYVNHVNSATFYGAPAKCALCKRISAKLQKKNAFTYWRTTYVFWFKLESMAVDYPAGFFEPWGARVANMGRRQPKLASVAGRLNYEAVKDANGDAVSTPVPLGLDGLPLSASDNTVWLGFRLKKTANFGALNLE